MSTDEEDKYASMTFTVSGRLLNDLRVGAMLPCDKDWEDSLDEILQGET